jgi:predicted NAD/FAD-binding protein
MDAQSLDVSLAGVEARVDVPLRVIYEGYYPTLLDVYHSAEIGLEQVSYSASFSQVRKRTHFRYENWKLPWGMSVPFIKPSQLLCSKTRQIIRDLARFLRDVSRPARRGIIEEQSIDSYLTHRGYSDAFRHGFLFPAFAGICTCSLESVKRYPTDIIADYLTGGILLTGVRRVVSGVHQVVERLLAEAREVRCDAAVQRVSEENDQVVVCDSRGERRVFDHLIIATQANQALRFLGERFEREREVLSAFEYEKSRVLMHTDVRLAPHERTSWSPVNFVNEREHNAPMATIWMNSVQPELRSLTIPLFQTWNPVLEPRDEHVLSDAMFERPVVTLKTRSAIEALWELHDAPGRRVWFCGSYASQGVPLLESAARSAVDVSNRINASRFPT